MSHRLQSYKFNVLHELCTCSHNDMLWDSHGLLCQDCATLSCLSSLWVPVVQIPCKFCLHSYIDQEELTEGNVCQAGRQRRTFKVAKIFELGALLGSLLVYSIYIPSMEKEKTVNYHS